VSLDGEDVSEVIRSRAVSSAVSAVASVPEVRARLVAMQRAAIVSACAEGQGIVAEGRDIGTVVAPQAIVKVFLTAAEDIRAQRRGADQGVTTGAIQDEQRSRDAADAPRTVMAADAVMVDSTALSLDEVVAAIVGLARDRSTGQRPRRPADAAWTT
jgi:cytidylate kinase